MQAIALRPAPSGRVRRTRIAPRCRLLIPAYARLVASGTGSRNTEVEAINQRLERLEERLGVSGVGMGASLAFAKCCSNLGVRLPL